MSLPGRILRLAKHRLLRGWRHGKSPRTHAREELDQALREPSRSSAQPSRTVHARPSQAPPRGAGAEPASGTSSARAGAAQTGASAKPGAAASSHPYAAEYGLLGVPAGADFLTVRRAWRTRVKESHPDRFAGDPAAQRQAADRLRAINGAYEALERHLNRG